jgi:hypothetical protein
MSTKTICESTKRTERKMTDRRECNEALLNLYAHLRGDEAPPSQQFVIRKIFDTEKCQEHHDLRTLREVTTQKLCEVSPGKTVEEARNSEAACAEVVAELKLKYRRGVLRALPWSTQAWYFSKDNDQQLQQAASLGLGGAVAWATRSAAAGVFAAGVTGAVWKIFKK